MNAFGFPPCVCGHWRIGHGFIVRDVLSNAAEPCEKKRCKCPAYMPASDAALRDEEAPK